MALFLWRELGWPMVQVISGGAEAGRESSRRCRQVAPNCRSARSIPPAVWESSSPLRDEAAVHLDGLDVVVIAEMNVHPEHASKVPRTPPVVRKAIDDECGQQPHSPSLADASRPDLPFGRCLRLSCKAVLPA